MSSMRSVIITLPKNMQKSSLVGNELNFTTSILAGQAKMEVKMEQSLEDMSCGEIDEIVKPDGWARGKKRRLDHLTWEEKLQRKKLKNRVAAQTSRDRKKAKLDELEDTVRALRDSHDILSEECAMLRSQNELLVKEAEKLRQEREMAKKNEENYCAMCQARVGCGATALGSAVSPLNPLPQGGATQPASALTQNASIILRILTLYLLSRNSSEISKEMTTLNSKNLLKTFCEKLPQKWKQVLIDQMNRPQQRTIPLKSLTIQEKWWGRHQKMWKPVQSVKG